MTGDVAQAGFRRVWAVRVLLQVFLCLHLLTLPGGALADEADRQTGFLPEGRLFEPLLADPRWPHFSLAYHSYRGDPELSNILAVSFGETIGLYRGRTLFRGGWQVGIQGAVFSILDLDADSFDLVNSDFMVALPVTARWGSLSALARLLHQSSHLGDEYLLRKTVERVNLSYESGDVLLSLDLSELVRVFGGAGYIFRRDPGDLAPASVRYGFELTPRRPWAGGRLRPLVGVMTKQWEEHGWNVDLSAKAGLVVEKKRIAGRRLVLTLEHFRGHSPNGQFYDRSVEYTGLGVHFFF